MWFVAQEVLRGMKPRGLDLFHGLKLLSEIQADGFLAGIILWQLVVPTNPSLERPWHNALVQGTFCSAWSQNQRALSSAKGRRFQHRQDLSWGIQMEKNAGSAGALRNSVPGTERKAEV